MIMTLTVMHQVILKDDTYSSTGLKNNLETDVRIFQQLFLFFSFIFQFFSLLKK